MVTTPKEVAQVLNYVNDPEIKISIVELGLIYGIFIEEGKVTVHMTLTTPACPYGPMLKDMTVQAIGQIPGVSEAQVGLVWEPVWDPMAMASEEAKTSLGLVW